MSNTSSEKKKTSIEDWIKDGIEVFARDGKMQGPILRLYGDQIEPLTKEGFTVRVLRRTGKPGQFFCIPNWSKPTVPNSLASQMHQLTIAALQKNSK